MESENPIYQKKPMLVPPFLPKSHMSYPASEPVPPLSEANYTLKEFQLPK